MFGGAEVLNSNPAGALKTRVSAGPGPKSPLLPSVITMGPKVVHAGELALAALSAGMAVPPVAGASITFANEETSRRQAYATISRKKTGTRREARVAEKKVRRPTQTEQTFLAETTRTFWMLPESDSVWIEHGFQTAASPLFKFVRVRSLLDS